MICRQSIKNVKILLLLSDQKYFGLQFQMSVSQLKPEYLYFDSIYSLAKYVLTSKRDGCMIYLSSGRALVRDKGRFVRFLLGNDVSTICYITESLRTVKTIFPIIKTGVKIAHDYQELRELILKSAGSMELYSTVGNIEEMPVVTFNNEEGILSIAELDALLGS